MMSNIALRKSLGYIATFIAALTFVGCGGGGGGSTPPPPPAATAASIAGLNPTTIVAGSQDFTLTVQGANIKNGATVMWNGAAKTTTFDSAAQVSATISAKDVAAQGTATVTVVNPGAQASNSLSFTITQPIPNPVPFVTTLSPAGAQVGTSGLSLIVNGVNFVANSKVRWNGADRPTTYINNGQLRATIATSDLETAGTVQVTVFNPTPGGGLSTAASFVIEPKSTRVALPVNKLVYDPARKKLYASVPSRAGTNGNSIAVIDPATGTVTSTIPIGSEPNALALSQDGTYLYVGLDGPGAVRRLDLNTQDASFQFSLGTGTFGQMYAADIAVMPGSSQTIAVSRRFNGISPSHAGVAIYDNGVARTNITQTHTGSNVIEFSDSPQVLYGMNTETTEFGFRQLNVDPNGVVELRHVNFGGGFGADFKFSGGRAYLTSGAVIDANMVLAGTFNAPQSTSVAVDTDKNQTDFLSCTYGKCTITAFDNDSFVSLGSQQVSTSVSWYGRNLVRTGATSLAFTTDSDQLVLVAMTFATPAATDKTINTLVTNHLVYDSTRQRVYASVPSRAGARGNSIAVIDPSTSQIESLIPVGSEPNVLAISKDARYLYVGLDGAGAVRRVDLDTKTAGLQFALGSDSFFGPYYAEDMSVMPGSPETVAISLRYSGVSPKHAGVGVWDNGVRRANMTPSHTGSNTIEFSDSPDTLYGFNNETTEYGFRRMKVDATGVSTVSTLTNVLTGFATRITFDSGRVYSTDGVSLDPVAGRRLGRFAGISYSSGVIGDTASGKVYFARYDGTAHKVALYAMDSEKFIQLGSLLVAGTTSSPLDFVHAGSFGFVVSTAEGVVITNEAFTPPPTVGPGIDNLPANRLVYDSTRKRIYASVPGRAGSIGNTVAVINPATSQIESSFFAGSEPNVMALSGDGKYLYVGLDGAAAVRRFNLESQTMEPTFDLGPIGWFGPLMAEDIAVMPGNSDVIAVSRRYDGISPRHAGVAILDNGVLRATVTPDHTGSNAIEFAENPGTLYGYNNETTEFGFRRMKVDSMGVSVIDTASNLISGFSTDIAYAAGRVYSGNGYIVDPVRDIRAGRFTGIGQTDGFVTDAAASRVYFLSHTSGTGGLSILGYDTGTYLPTGTLGLSSAAHASSFIRAGEFGFALALSTGRVMLVNGTFTPPPSGGTGIDTLPANHLVYDSGRQRIYASVPSRAGTRGNSIAVIDPQTKTVEKTIFVGSEPNALALSKDASALYVGLDGTGTIRKVDLTTGTAGIEFSVGYDSFFGPMYADDISVAPTDATLIAVSRRYDGVSPRHAGVAVFADGVQRPTTTPGHTGANAIEFSDSSGLVYGYNNETSEFGFYKMKVDAAGITTTETVPGLIGGFGTKIVYESSRIYATSGVVVDPVADSLLGRFAGAQGSVSVAPDTAAGRVYFLYPTFGGKPLVLVYDQSTMQSVGSLELTSGDSLHDLLRCGPAGLAYATSSAVVITGITDVIPPKALDIATTVLPPTSVGKLYAFAMVTNGGYGSVNWNLTADSGPLPPGLLLASNGMISGTVGDITADKTFTFRVQATDSATPPASSARDMSILVKKGGLGRNDSCNTATPISFGTLSGSLSPYGDIDVYSFQGKAGTEVTVETYAQRLSSYADTVVQLLDSSCNPLITNDDIADYQLDSFLTYTLPADGTYYVRVLDARGDGRPELNYMLLLSHR